MFKCPHEAIPPPCIMQRKIATTPPLKALVSSTSDAAFVVDVRRGVLLAANDAAASLWSTAGAPLHLPLSLDRAMPALTTLQFVASRRSKAEDVRSSDLIFWTGQGVCRVDARVRSLAALGHPDCVLVAVPFEPSVEADNCAASEATQAAMAPSAPDANDLATLARIRAAIESGGNDDAAVWTEPEALFESARSRTGVSAASPQSPPDPQGEVLARVAHEVRTPLAAIAALADVMRQEHFGPIRNARYREYIADIHDSALHALEVVTGMLEPTAWSLGRPAVVQTRLQLNPVVAASLSSMRPLAEASGLRLVGKLTPRLPAVLIDVGSLRQMLLNLIANAIQYAGSGATVTVATMRGTDGRLRLEVRDNGGGMAAAKIARILGPADKSLPAAGDRRGLGLPFTRLLAEANGAELTLSARRGRGTRAAIVMPVAPRARPATKTAAKPRPKSRPRSSRRS